MIFDTDHIILWSWEGVGALWLGAMLFTKPSLQRQSSTARLLQVVIAGFGFVLFAGYWPRLPWLQLPFLPASPFLPRIGAAITAVGCMFAAWARITLGANWSGRVTLKANHTLTTRGPYALTRHPIYTGILLAAAGSSIATDKWRALFGFAVLACAFALKMRAEERLMLSTFPNDYSQYRRRVKALIPGLF